MPEHTPSLETIRHDYVLLNTRNFDAYQVGRSVSSERQEYADRFDRAISHLLREAQAEAWDEGHSWGWSDAQDAHDVRQHMDRADWHLSTPNPYRAEDRAGETDE